MNKDIKEKRQKFLQQCLGHRLVHLIGPMPLEDAPKEFLEPCLLVDGGLEHKVRCIGPSLSLGDGDSSSSEMDILLEAKKNFTDLNFALGVIKQLDLKEIYLWGFLGGRKDHEITNFGEVFHFLKEKQGFVAKFNQGVRFFAPGSYTLNFQGTFSFINFQDNEISLKGSIEYPLEESTSVKMLSGHTLSNVAKGEFQLTCKLPVLLISDLS